MEMTAAIGSVKNNPLSVKRVLIFNHLSFIIQGTGATLLATGCHLVFLFSFPILLLTAMHFLLGATLHHGVCNTLRQPASSDVFKELDRAVLTPILADVFNENPDDSRTALQVIQDCHANQSLYNVLGLEKVYNISSLGSWRSTWGIGSPLSSLGSAKNLGLKGVVLLPKDAEVDLKQLSKSPLASLDLSQFSSLGGEEVTVVDIQKLVRRLRTLQEQVGRREEMREVANQFELEVRYLDNMVTVGKELSLTARRLLDRLEQLDKDLGGEGQASLASNLPTLIASAAKAEITLRSTGDSLVNGLANQLATEAADLVDAYVNKVEGGVRQQVGACAPLSEAFNATITAVCSEVIFPSKIIKFTISRSSGCGAFQRVLGKRGLVSFSFDSQYDYFNSTNFVTGAICCTFPASSYPLPSSNCTGLSVTLPLFGRM